MSITVMKKALEALEIGWSPKYVNGVDAREKGMKAITSLRQAIAEAEKQEPVVYCEIHHLPEPCVQCAKEHEGYNTHPQPKREPLTDERIQDLKATYLYSIHGFIHGETEFARAIEAAHGIKD